MLVIIGPTTTAALRGYPRVSGIIIGAEYMAALGITGHGVVLKSRGNSKAKASELVHTFREVYVGLLRVSTAQVSIPFIPKLWINLLPPSSG
jgi:hypothetical protein